MQWHLRGSLPVSTAAEVTVPLWLRSPLFLSSRSATACLLASCLLILMIVIGGFVVIVNIDDGDDYLVVEN
jgi:hypothetical protein